MVLLLASVLVRRTALLLGRLAALGVRRILAFYRVRSVVNINTTELIECLWYPTYSCTCNLACRCPR